MIVTQENHETLLVSFIYGAKITMDKMALLPSGPLRKTKFAEKREIIV